MTTPLQLPTQRSRLLGPLLIALAVVLAACGAPATTGEPQDVVVVPTIATTSESVLEQLAADSDFALFLSAWNAVGLTQNLQQGGPFTVFAPTNTAFSRLGTTISSLDAATLQPLLQHHVVTQTLQPDELAAAGILTSAAGAPIATGGTPDALTVAYATVVGEPIQAGNGVIYPVDSVLLPPEAGTEKSLWGLLLADDRFKSLVQAMEGTDTMYSLRFSDEPDAFLAPTNEAMSALTLDLSGLARTDELYDSLFAFHVMMPEGWPLDQNLSAADMIARGDVQTGVVASRSGGVVFTTVPVVEENGVIRVGNGTLIETDISGANGMLHVIDTVLIPPTLAETE